MAPGAVYMLSSYEGYMMRIPNTPGEEETPMPSPIPTDHETIDVRAELDRLIDQLPPIALLRLWRLLIAWTAPRLQRRRGTMPVRGRREG